MQGSPTTHFVDFPLVILYRGAELAVVWKQFAVVLLIGAICFAVALARFRRMLAVMQNIQEDACTGFSFCLTRASSAAVSLLRP